MIYIENASTDPYFNQAFEEYVFNKYTDGEILLLWRNSPAVVCGRSQNIFAEVDVNEAAARGVALIRRISGGGTVYHDQGNLNYTIIRDQDQLALDYDAFLKPVIAALQKIGVPAAKNRTSDISIDGLKVSGSAQRGTMKRLLHHGTLLYDCDLNALTSLSNGQREHFTTKGSPSVPWPVTNIRDHMEDKSMSVEEFSEALLDALLETVPSGQDEIVRRVLTEDELAEVRELADEKYRSWEWTFGKSPAFTYHREFEFNETDMQVDYSAKHGVIQDITFTPRFPDAEAALTGQRLDIDAFPDEFKELIKYIM